MTKRSVVLLTLTVWLVGTSIYVYQSLAAAYADRPSGGYESDPHFIVVGFIVGFILYRGVFLFIGLIIVIWAELMLFETVFRKS